MIYETRLQQAKLTYNSVIAVLTEQVNGDFLLVYEIC